MRSSTFYYLHLTQSAVVDDKVNDLHEKIHPRFCGPWGEDWDEKFARIRDKSPFKDFESLQVRAVIVKGGDDLR